MRRFFQIIKFILGVPVFIAGAACLIVLICLEAIFTS